MEINENTYDRIQKYLDNELEGEELLGFESEKKADSKLAQEVILNKEMKELLEDSIENELRKNLQVLNNRVTSDPNGFSFSWKYLLLPLPFFIAIGWFLLNPESSKSNSIQKENTEANTPEPLINAPEDPIIDSSQTPEIPPQEPIQNTKQESTQDSESQNISSKKPVPPPKEETKKEKARPIAEETSPPPTIEEPVFQVEEVLSSLPPTNAPEFEPNPQLEILVENSTRNNDFELVIEHKQEDVIIEAEEGTVNFQFKANLNSSEGLEGKNFSLHLFSNDKAQFEDFNPLSSDGIKLVEIEAKSYQIDFQKALNLKHGVYYYLIEDVATERIYYANKFLVQ